MVSASVFGISAGAQSAEPSSTGAQKSATEDTSSGNFPVSLEHIREGLANAPARSLLLGLDRAPDFRAEAQIQTKLDQLLSTLDLKTGPKPPGGLYWYEQQQRLWNSTLYPLMQPYAAFSAGELITLAIEGLAERYLMNKAAGVIGQADRTRAEQMARTEVLHAIAEYCGAQPSGGANIEICTASFLWDKKTQGDFAFR
jgi:hypothetical protein